MMSRIVSRHTLGTRICRSLNPPVFGNQGRYFNSTAQVIETPQSEAPLAPKVAAALSFGLSKVQSSTTTSPAVDQGQDSKLLPDSVKNLLPLLLVQPSHFIITHIHARPYLITPGDIVRLPFRMPGVVPGDILRLNRASVIGSRDYTLKGAPYLDERIFECRARVLGTEGEPVRVKEKTKRRNRKVKTVRSKHKFTILRVTELRIKSLEEIAS
jgi:large subunit ribosomal protein L21